MNAESIKSAILYIDKTVNEEFLCINNYDNIIKVHKCTLYCVHDEDDYSDYKIEEFSPYNDEHYLCFENFELKDYGFSYEHGDDGHYGVIYYVNLCTHKDVAVDLIFKNIRYHEEEINKNKNILNFIF